ncbi:MAG: hypothetical protein AAFY57_20370 [Cyanobacteria bacterium J06642_2]
MTEKIEQSIRSLEKEREFYAGIGDDESEAECYCDLVMMRNQLRKMKERSQ